MPFMLRITMGVDKGHNKSFVVLYIGCLRRTDVFVPFIFCQSSLNRFQDKEDEMM